METVTTSMPVVEVETFVVQDEKFSKENKVSTKSGVQKILETIKTVGQSPRVETYIVEEAIDGNSRGNRKI